MDKAGRRDNTAARKSNAMKAKTRRDDVMIILGDAAINYSDEKGMRNESFFCQSSILPCSVSMVTTRCARNQSGLNASYRGRDDIPGLSLQECPLIFNQQFNDVGKCHGYNL